jgi:hypothetical protein
MPDFSELKPSQLLAEEEKRREALLEAKASGDKKKLDKAKAAVDELRTYQRTRRDDAAAAANDGVARPDTVRASTSVKES